VEQRRKRRWFRRRTKRGLIAAGAVGALVVTVVSVLWLRCGVNGCPDVDMLRGYMPDEASVVVDRNGEEIVEAVRDAAGGGAGGLHAGAPAECVRRHRGQAVLDARRRGLAPCRGRAAQNIRAGDIEEGSSTITMQLARNVFPDKLPASERTLMAEDRRGAGGPADRGAVRQA
jgi:hypothetical protein